MTNKEFNYFPQFTYDELVRRQNAESIKSIIAAELAEQKRQIAPLLREEQDRIDKRRLGVTWLDQEDKKVYVGQGEKGTYNRSDNHYIADLNVMLESPEKFKNGQWNSDQATFKPISPEWQDQFNEYIGHLKKVRKGNRESAAILTSKDFATLATVNIYGDLLDQQQREYTLPQAVTVIPTNELDLRVDTWERFTVDEEVSEMAVAETRQGRITSQNFTLSKAVGEYAWSDEFEMRTREHDILALHRQNAVSDLPRVKALKIAVQLATFAGVSGSSWSAFVAGTDRSATDPRMEIYDAMSQVFTNYGQIDTLVSNTKTYLVYSGNSYIRGILQAQGPLPQGPTPRIINAPGLLPGITWYIDESVPTGTVYAFTKAAIMLLQGPVRTELYRDPRPGVNGFKISDWHGANIRTAGQGRKITGVAS